MSELPADPAPRPDRRRFLTGGARGVIVLGMLGYFLQQGRRARRLAGDPTCVRIEPCASCAELPAGCALPKADAFRHARLAPGERAPRSTASDA